MAGLAAIVRLSISHPLSPIHLRMPLRDLIESPRRRNAIAAVLSAIALLVLAVALFLPLIEIDKMGQITSHSLIGGIVRLFEDGHVGLGVLLGAFSVVFPILKLATILVATSAQIGHSRAARRKWAKLAILSGKYSLLDVLVVAILVVVVKLEGMVEIQPRIGTAAFSLAIFISLIAGLVTDLDGAEAVSEDAETEGPTTLMTDAAPADRPRQRRHRFVLPWYTIPAALVLAGAGYVAYEHRGVDAIRAIRVTASPAALDLTGLLNKQNDYYLKLRLGVEELELNTYKNTPIGNGLSWYIHRPMTIEDISEVSIWDKDALGRDDQLDRIDVTALEVSGQKFTFHFDGDVSEYWWPAIGLCWGSGFIFVTGLLRFVFDQALD